MRKNSREKTLTPEQISNIKLKHMRQLCKTYRGVIDILLPYAPKEIGGLQKKIVATLKLDEKGLK